MQSFQTRLNERKQQFLNKLPERIAEMEALAKSGGGDDLALLLKHFHKLAGAGGIYELGQFCEASIAAEEFTTKVVSGEVAFSTSVQNQLLEFCGRIRDAAAKDQGKLA